MSGCEGTTIPGTSSGITKADVNIIDLGNGKSQVTRVIQRTCSLNPKQGSPLFFRRKAKNGDTKHGRVVCRFGQAYEIVKPCHVCDGTGRDPQDPTRECTAEGRNHRYTPSGEHVIVRHLGECRACAGRGTWEELRSTEVNNRNVPAVRRGRLPASPAQSRELVELARWAKEQSVVGGESSTELRELDHDVVLGRALDEVTKDKIAAAIATLVVGKEVAHA